MAYRPRRRRWTTARASTYRRTGYRSRRRTTRRRATRAQRIVIQVVGGGPAGAVTAAPVTMGSKGYRPVRSRY